MSNESIPNYSFKIKEGFCHECNNQLISLDELFDKPELSILQKNFTDNMGGQEFPRSACNNCGSVYDKYFNKRDYSLPFLKRFLNFNNPHRQF